MAEYPRFRHVCRSAVLMAVWYALTPNSGHTDEVVKPPDQILSDELQLLKEEESVDAGSQAVRPISFSSSEPYVMTEEDIRNSGAEDLPALFRRILSLALSQMAGSNINRGDRVDDQPIANNLLVMVDGHSSYIDASDALTSMNIPVTLPEIKRLEMWKESTSPSQEANTYHLVIKISTKTPGK
ncbi:MAG TPA: hypothetical protein VI359_01485 [Nitrospiraceae bacterium]